VHTCQDEADQIADAGRTFLISYQHLTERAVARRDKLWHLRPKFHQFDHLLDWTQATRMNPKMTANWGEEDLIGKLKRIGKNTHRKTASRRVLERWSILQHRRISERKKSGRFLLRTRINLKALLKRKRHKPAQDQQRT
jgi:hypothetical protein